MQTDNNGVHAGSAKIESASSDFLKTDGGKTKSNAIEVPSIKVRNLSDILYHLTNTLFQIGTQSASNKPGAIQRGPVEDNIKFLYVYSATINHVRRLGQKASPVYFAGFISFIIIRGVNALVTFSTIKSLLREKLFFRFISKDEAPTLTV